jgi:glutamate synthase (NADPH) large chain
MDEMIGRVDRLIVKKAVDHWKARGLDFSQILYQPEADPEVATRRVREQDHGLDKSLDLVTILPLCRDALESKKPVDIILPIRNVNRTVGTILGSEVSRSATEPKACRRTRSASISTAPPGRASAPSCRAG